MEYTFVKMKSHLRCLRVSSTVKSKNVPLSESFVKSHRSFAQTERRGGATTSAASGNEVNARLRVYHCCKVRCLRQGLRPHPPRSAYRTDSVQGVQHKRKGGGARW